MNDVVIALIFNLMDLITGFIGALRLKQIKSGKLRNGVYKKFGFIMCYVLAGLIDRYGKEIGFTLEITLLPIVITYVVITEIVSIIENISRINPDLVPDKLKDIFHLEDIGGDHNAGH